MSRALRLALFASSLALSACRRESSEPIAPPAPSAVAVAVASVIPSATSSAAPSAAPSSAPAPSGSPVGGLWVRCYAHFRPTSTPSRDLLRLTTLCGPETGMHALAAPIEENVGEAPIDHVIKLSQGECVRVFAVADSAIADLDLALLSPRGETLAVDAIDDRWPILSPDKPVCVTETGAYTIRTHARRGTGTYAMQAWLLP